jgi:hypothetical protein
MMLSSPTQRVRDVAFRWRNQIYWNLTPPPLQTTKLLVPSSLILTLMLTRNQRHAGPELDSATPLQPGTGPEPTSGSRGSEHKVDRKLMVEVEREIFGEANRVHGATPFVARCGATLKAVRSLSLDRNRVASFCRLRGGGGGQL